MIYTGFCLQAEPLAEQRGILARRERVLDCFEAFVSALSARPVARSLYNKILGVSSRIICDFIMKKVRRWCRHHIGTATLDADSGVRVGDKKRRFLR